MAGANGHLSRGYPEVLGSILATGRGLLVMGERRTQLAPWNSFDFFALLVPSSYSYFSPSLSTSYGALSSTSWVADGVVSFRYIAPNVACDSAVILQVGAPDILRVSDPPDLGQRMSRVVQCLRASSPLTLLPIKCPPRKPCILEQTAPKSCTYATPKHLSSATRLYQPSCFVCLQKGDFASCTSCLVTHKFFFIHGGQGC